MGMTEQSTEMHTEIERSRPGSPNPMSLAESRSRRKALALWQLMEQVLAGFAWNG